MVEGDVDYGPATKALPAARRWRGTATDLLLCDDDRLQDREWVCRFVDGRAARPDDILCERGWNIEEQVDIHKDALDMPRALRSAGGGRTLAYRMLRLASLTLYHPQRKVYEEAVYVVVL